MYLLHILNGDSSLQLFKASGLEGKTMVWREMLCEGPCDPNLNADIFWETRKAFMKARFGVPEEDYHKKVVQEIAGLENWVSATEVVLWFEYDLFCQVNIMAVLSWFAEQELPRPLSLICVGDFPDSEKRLGLGELSADQYPALFAERIELELDDLRFASRFWKAWTSGDPRELEFALEPHPRFIYLQDAMRAHFQRYPEADTGLNLIEKTMLTFIDNGDLTRRQVIGAMLRWQRDYGFGDLQYEKYLDDLSGLISGTEILRLSEVGAAVLAGRQRFERDKSRTPALPHLENYVWDPKARKNLKT